MLEYKIRIPKGKRTQITFSLEIPLVLFEEIYFSLSTNLFKNNHIIKEVEYNYINIYVFFLR